MIGSEQLHLTEPRGEDFSRQLRNTHPGMAHFAGTGPHGATCRGCIFWNIGPLDWHSPNGKHGGALKARSCRAYTKYTMGQTGPKVPHDASACKHFEANLEPPAARRANR